VTSLWQRPCTHCTHPSAPLLLELEVLELEPLVLVDELLGLPLLLPLPLLVLLGLPLLLGKPLVLGKPLLNPEVPPLLANAPLAPTVMPVSYGVSSSGPRLPQPDAATNTPTTTDTAIK
jgi:hypothetical protein